MSKNMEGGPSQHEKEQNEYTRTDIFPGRILGEQEVVYPGQPEGYFVRAEGTTNTLDIKTGSLEDMMEELFGPGALDFMTGMYSPEKTKMIAETMRDKINDPATQQKVRELFAARQRLREELFGY